MNERPQASEHTQPRVAEKVRERLADKLFRPVSSAREKQFREIIQVLPEGALKKSYENMLPQLRDMLKIKDFDTVTSEVITRSVMLLGGGVFAGAGFAFLIPSHGFTALHAAVGTGMIIGAFSPFGPAARERKGIANETINNKNFYSTTAGKDAARAWNKLPGGNTDQIVRAIIMGTSTMRGTPGAALPMTGIPGAGGIGS
jgi:hypothetical protein